MLVTNAVEARMHKILQSANIPYESPFYITVNDYTFTFDFVIQSNDQQILLFCKDFQHFSHPNLYDYIPNVSLVFEQFSKILHIQSTSIYSNPQQITQKILYELQLLNGSFTNLEQTSQLEQIYRLLLNELHLAIKHHIPFEEHAAFFYMQNLLLHEIVLFLELVFQCNSQQTTTYKGSLVKLQPFIRHQLIKIHSSANKQPYEITLLPYAPNLFKLVRTKIS